MTKHKKFAAVIMLSFTLSESLFAQLIDKQKLAYITKHEQNGTEYFVDASSIEKYGDERIALVQEKKPDVWYNKIERNVIDGYDSKIHMQAFRCNANTMAIYSTARVDESGNIIKQEYSYPYGDQRVVYSNIPPNSIASSIANYVCNARVVGTMNGTSSTRESRIIKGNPSPTDWANLGPDASNSYSVFMLKTSVLKKGSYIGYVSKLEYMNPIIVDGQPVKVQVSEIIYDCKNSRFQTLKRESISPAGNLLSESKIDAEFAGWDPAPKGSFVERIGSVYCK